MFSAPAGPPLRRPRACAGPTKVELPSRVDACCSERALYYPPLDFLPSQGLEESHPDGYARASGYHIYSTPIPPYESNDRSSPYTLQESQPGFVPQMRPSYGPLRTYNQHADPIHASATASGLSMMYASQGMPLPPQPHHEQDLEHDDYHNSEPLQDTVKKVRKRRRLLSQGELPRDEALRKHLCLVPGCGKKFARPSALATHNLSHTKEKRTSYSIVDSADVRSLHLRYL